MFPKLNSRFALISSSNSSSLSSSEPDNQTFSISGSGKAIFQSLFEKKPKRESFGEVGVGRNLDDKVT